MTATERQQIVRMLEQSKGDDLYRARHAFRHFTLEQLHEEHGQSGKTRLQILKEYEANNDRVDRLIAAVKEAK